MNKANAFRNDLLANGWTVTSSTPFGITYSRPIPDSLDKAMRIASASSRCSMFTPIKDLLSNFINRKKNEKKM